MFEYESKQHLVKYQDIVGSDDVTVIMRHWYYRDKGGFAISHNERGPAQLHYTDGDQTTPTLVVWQIGGDRMSFDLWASFYSRCSEVELVELKLKYG